MKRRSSFRFLGLPTRLWLPVLGFVLVMLANRLPATQPYVQHALSLLGVEQSPSSPSTTTPSKSLPPQATESKRYTCRVLRIVDGDTFTCDINGNGVEDGNAEKVRLLQVDTPEVHHSHRNPSGKPQPGGLEALAFTKKQLLGKTVTLLTDKKPRDRYGRLLAWVFVGTQAPESTEAMATRPELRLKSINTQLLRLGLATAMIYAPNTTLATESRADDRLSTVSASD